MKKLFVILSISSLYFSSCKTLQPVRPVFDYTPIVINPPESFVNIPLDIDLNAIEKIVNEQTPNLIYEGTYDKASTGSTVKYKVLKDGHISVSTANDKINYTLGLLITGKYSQNLLIGNADKDFSVHASINAQTGISIDENWTVQLSSKADVKITDPIEINILGYTMSFNDIINNAITKEINSRSGEIDKEVADEINLRQEVENAWKKLNDPFLTVSTPVQVWAYMQPTAFNMSPLKTINPKRLSVNIGLKTKIQTQIGSKPVVNALGPLPKIQTIVAKQNNYEINLPVSIQISEIKESIKKEFVGKTYPIPNTKREITINDIDFYGAGEKAVIMLDFTSKKTNGIMYLVGKPVYNDSTHVMEVQDLNFSTSTDKALVNNAAWLVSKLFLKTIQKNAKYDATKDINDAKAAIEKSLNGMDLNPNFKLKGTVDEFHISNLYIKGDYVVVNIDVKGKLDGKIVEKK